MADESKVQVRLRILGAALAARDARKVAGALKEIDRGGRAAGKGLDQIKGGRVGGALRVVSRASSIARAGLGGLQSAAGAAMSALSSAGRVVSRVASRIKTAGLIMAGAGTAFALSTARTGIGFNAQFQDAETSFKTFLGTAERARAFMEQLRERVSTGTIFRLTEAMGAARMLLGYGMAARKVAPTLRAISNAIIATGGNAEHLERVTLAIGQMQAKGKVSAEELRQLAEAGIPANKILQRELRLTGEQVANIGEEGINAERGIAALVRGLNRRFKGAAEEARNNWSVQVMDLRKSWEQLQRVVSEPLFRWLNRSVMPRLISAVQGTIRIFSDEDLAFPEKVQAMLDAIRRQGRVGSAVADAASGVGGFVSGLLGRIQPPAPPGQGARRALAGVGASTLTSQREAQRARQLTAGVGELAQGPSAAQQAAQQAGRRIRSILGDIITWGRANLPKIGQTIRGVASDVLEALRPATPFLENVLLPLLRGVGEGVLGAVVGAFRVAVPIVRVFSEALGFLGRAAEPLQGVLRNVGRVIGFVLAGPILKGIGALSTMGGKVPILFRAVGVAARVLATPIRLVVGVVKNLGGVFRIVGSVARLFGSGLQFVNRWLAFSTSSFGRALFAVTNFASGIIGRLARVPGQAAARIRDLIGRIVGGLRNAVGRVASAAGSVGRAILRGITSVISRGKDLLAGALRTVIDTLPLPGFIKGRLKDALGLHAHGGTVRTPLQVVGEHGPELAALPSGTQVMTASRTRRVLREQRPRVTVLAQPKLAPMYANLVVNLDGRELHRGIYRVERAMAEAR